MAPSPAYSIGSRWKKLITNDESRQHFQFTCIFIIMASISGFMTVMNFFTGWRQALITATLTFTILNIMNAMMESYGNRKTQKIARVLFAIEIIILFTFFVINGQPKGFSTLWAALLPISGLLIYRGPVGSLISGIQFVILVFLFYFPAGQNLLRYEYTDVFMMRFPVLYAAFFVVGLFFELIRHYTQKELTATRDRYKQENFRIIQVLADEYKTVLSVDLESGKMDIYSGPDAFPSAMRERSFYDSIAAFADKVVAEESREQFKDFFTKETILNNLEKESNPSLTFISVIDGVERYHQAKIVRIPEESGQTRQVIAAFSDADSFIREQQHIQQELLQQRSKAEAASKAKTDFLFNMSHDIRTPMNAIIGFTNMAIKEADNPEKVRKCLQNVRLSGDMLLSLINDILDMSRIESGKVNITPVPADMETIFENIQSVMANLAVTKDIGLHFDIGKIRDRYVYADKARIDRILMNLVSNAIKYTECYGKVQVYCEQTDSGTPDCGIYRFTVKDNGIGMSEEFQKQMFEAFAREENSTVRGIQGTGLGLPLAKKLSEIMGGSISCDSKRGIGSEFTVTLPFKLRGKDASDAESADAGRSADIHADGKRVLLVEDNELNREITTYILEEKGMVIESASDGEEAVRIISEKGPGQYDIILMDIQMPVMNGFDAAAKIRALFPDSGIPIIALSANAFEEDKQKSLASGMNGHISKPINMAELDMMLSKFLKQ